MAFVITAVKAWGEHIEEPVTKKAKQSVLLTFTRTTSGDGTVNLSKRSSLSSGDFWEEGDDSATGAIAFSLWSDVMTKGQILCQMPVLTQVISSQSHMVAMTPTNYDNIAGDADVAVARNYSEGQVTFKSSATSLVDFDIDLYDAASGSTAITCTLLVEMLLKDGEKPTVYGM